MNMPQIEQEFRDGVLWVNMPYEQMQKFMAGNMQFGHVAERERIIKLLEEECVSPRSENDYYRNMWLNHAIALIKGEK